MTETADPRPPSRSWKRLHSGAPLKSMYVKLVSTAECSDCPWVGAAADAADAAMKELRAAARDHAAIEHHRVTVHLAQDVVLEPKHSQTRAKTRAGD